MNDADEPQPHPLWDRCRDGDLDEPERGRFERFLRSHPEAERLWRHESLWLAALAEQPPLEGEDGERFARRVIHCWQDRRARRASIAGRIGRWSAAAVAAAVVISSIVTVWVLRTGPAPSNQPAGPAAEDRNDPVAVLVADMNRQLERQPEQWRQAIDQTASLLSFRRIIDVLEASDGSPASEPRS